MKFIVFYFSGNGNTEWVIRRLGETILDGCHDYTMINIEDISDGDLSSLKGGIISADYVGFGTPIYGANLPIIMDVFLSKRLTVINRLNPNLKYFFVNTFGYVNGYGLFKVNKLLRSISKKTFGYLNVRMFNSAPSRNDVSTNPKFYERRLNHAIRQITSFSLKITNNRKYFDGIDPRLIVGILIRKKFVDEIQNNYLIMNVDVNKCTKCGLCVSSCPTQSIVNNGKYYSFVESCTSCMRCYNHCPTNAICVGKFNKSNGYVQYKDIEGSHY